MSVWKQNKNHICIKVPEIFDFKVNLAYLQREPNECMYTIEDDRITRVIEVNRVPILVRIGLASPGFLDVVLLSQTKPILTAEKEAIVDYISDWFDLGNDLTPFYEMGYQDPLLKQAIETFYGLRNIGINNLFETLCWGIIGQQINLPFAYTLKRQFVEKFGESIDYDGKKYWIFPTFHKISGLSIEDMADIKMTKKKKEYIIGIAKLMKDGDITKEKLLHLDFKQAEKELMHIRGIGPWTANYVCMRCLRYPNAFPMDDVGLINAIKVLKGMDRKPTKTEIKELSSTWIGWESYATFYLWRMLY